VGDFGGALTARLGRRHAAGPEAADALARAADVRADGAGAVLARYVGHAVRGDGAADAARDRLVALLEGAAATGLATDGGLDVAVPAACLGEGDGAAVRVRAVCAAAAAAGAAVLLSPLDGRDAPAAAGLVRRLAGEHPHLGLEVWAGLRTAGGDLREVLDRGYAAAAGGDPPPRVLLRAGGGPRTPPPGLSLPGPSDADRAFLRYAKRVLRAPLRVSLAPGDATLIRIVEAIADGATAGGPAGVEGSAGAAGDPGGPASSHPWWEVVVELGVRTDEARRLAVTGRRVRVEVPFGPRWRAVGLRRTMTSRRGRGTGLAR
jgi:proline dehydrogenase